MVIVTVTRNDLRDEFAMADEAFALSPISARAALPSDADYDAIREAFMETSRGRWFLTEYAKRNRNADTTMVLDAVARIEQTLATQKQTAPDDGLAKALTAIRFSLEEAQTAAAATFDKQTRDDALAPMQKSVRIIREISWRWREIGGDGRICDLLDSQAEAIEGVHAQLAARDDATALHAAFGLIETTLEELSGSPAATGSPSRSDAVSSSPTETSDEDSASPAATFGSETEAVEESDALVGGGAAATAHGEYAPAVAVDEQDMAHDDAVLDMIALEMGASDFDEPATNHLDVSERGIAQSEPFPEPETIAESSNTSLAPEPSIEVAAQPSLGASLLASGIVTRAPPRSDPLAPIRRMTQAEKIAFFS